MTGNGSTGNGFPVPVADLMTLDRPFDTQALLEPFPPELIKQRKGSFGKVLDYIEWNKVVERVNAVTDNRWSCHVDWVQKCTSEEKVDTQTGEILTYPSYWAALITVTIPSMGSRSQVGTSPIQGDEVDCLKAAISDGLKKSFTLFGLGLYLYDEDSGNGEGRKVPRRPAAAGTRPAAAKPTARRPAGTAPAPRATAPATVPAAPPAPAAGLPLATEAQQRAIFAISQQVGFSSEQLQDILAETYSIATVEELTKADASAFISWLQEQQG